MNRHLASRLAPFAGFPILLAACGLPFAGGAGSSPAPDDGDVSHPTGATDVVLRMEHAGGFVMPEFLFSAVPPFTMYGDGTVLMTGPVPAIYPGPALPNLQSRRLSEAGMQAVLEAVRETGLFGTDARFDGAQVLVADATDTIFTLTADGPTVEVSIYGLGTLDPQNMPQEIPEADVQAHARLSTLANLLSAPDAQLGEGAWIDDAWRPYEPAALRLSVRTADADPPDGTENFAAWPIEGEDPAEFGEPGTLPDARCGAVSGEAAATWLEVLRAANASTRFTADDHRYAVTARPILPGEAPECPPAS